MKKILIVTMLLIAVTFVGNAAAADVSNNKAAAETGDYRENNPC